MPFCLQLRARFLRSEGVIFGLQERGEAANHNYARRSHAY